MTNSTNTSSKSIWLWSANTTTAE